MHVDTSRLPEPMRRRFDELNARTATEVVRDLMWAHFSDAHDIGEVRDDLRNKSSSGPGGLQRDLAALEEMLATPLPDGFLGRLVAWEGNWVLADPSDAGARAFLQEVAEMLRQVIAEAAAAPRRARRNRG